MRVVCTSLHKHTSINNQGLTKLYVHMSICSEGEGWHLVDGYGDSVTDLLSGRSLYYPIYTWEYIL